MIDDYDDYYILASISRYNVIIKIWRRITINNKEMMIDDGKKKTTTTIYTMNLDSFIIDYYLDLIWQCTLI